MHASAPHANARPSHTEPEFPCISHKKCATMAGEEEAQDTKFKKHFSTKKKSQIIGIFRGSNKVLSMPTQILIFRSGP